MDQDRDHGTEAHMDRRIDREFAHAFRASVADLAAPVAEITATSGRLGRRRQRLRRLRIAGTALAVVAVGCAGAVAVDGHGSPAPAAQQQATSPTGATTGPTGSTGSTASTSPAAPPAPAFTEPADTPLTAEAMAELLAEQLPAGGRFVKYQDASSTTGPFPEVGAFLSYDDGHGTSHIQLMFRRAADLSSASGGGCALGPLRPSGPPPGPLSCHDGYLADGSWEMVRATDALVTGLYGYQVTLWRPTGYLLILTEYSGTINAYGGKKAVTRPAPPVALDRWQAIAEDPRWQPKVPKSVVDAGNRLIAPVPHFPFPES
ncbi:hypothetical protein ACFW1A_39640 [Kitasatospora sp. NPDC058965]|uniref:hypothetical protein n=1 Tax=Kitasatospora sp. NPDC058965 TaxID=3346682 RepID=UPI003677E88C